MFIFFLSVDEERQTLTGIVSFRCWLEMMLVFTWAGINGTQRVQVTQGLDSFWLFRRAKTCAFCALLTLQGSRGK